MTWAELERIASNAICSELGNIPKTMAERVAKRIAEDVKIEFAEPGEIDPNDCCLLIEERRD